jgi:predicted short-subunit dehydrogenase-like oxidoreductase (DUF2520 family)
MKFYVIGAGKVGNALTRALRGERQTVTLRASRAGLPARTIVADLLVLAVRDGAVGPLASELAARSLVSRRTAVVHVAGALGPEALAPLREGSAGVAQAHPMVSFASRRMVPQLSGAHLLVAGDAEAVRRARRLARVLGMVAREWPAVDRTRYHAAAGLVANGAAALADAGARLLVLAGCPERDAASVLGPLLRSVAENVQKLGLPDALTGPVRRGDASTVLRHVASIEGAVPEILPLYRASVAAQLPMAAELGDASESALRDLARRVGVSGATAGKRRGKRATVARSASRR